MVASIGRDIAFRATIDDQTAKGAAAASRTMRSMADRAEREAKVISDRRDSRLATRDKLRMQKDIASSPISDEELRNEQYDRMNAESRRRLGGGGGKGGGAHGEGGGHAGHLSRIFSDASTTGLDTLSRGLLGGLSEKLGTGIQLGVLAVAGQSLNHLTEAAAELSTQFRKDEASAAGIAVKLGESIPLIGSFVSAGQNIREIFTGERVELERIKSFTLDIEAAHNRDLDTALKLTAARREYAAEENKIRRDIAGVHLRGSEKELHDIQSSAEAEKTQAENDIKKMREDALRDERVTEAQKKNKDFQDDGRGARLAKLNEALKTDPYDRAMFGSRLKERDSLKEQQETYKQEQKKAEADRDSGLAASIAHRQTTLHDNLEKSGEDEAEARKKTNERIYGGEREAINRDTQLREQSAVTALRTSGLIAEAKRKEIDARADAEIRQSAAELNRNRQATTDAHERELLEHQFAAHVGEINQQRNTDIAQSDKEIGLERIRISHDTLESQADAEAEARANRLREDGLGYEAEFALRQRANERAKQDIDQRADEAIAQNKDNEKEIRAKAEAEKSKLDSQYKEKERQAGEEKRNSQFNIAKDLLRGKQEALALEAQAGNAVSARAEKQLAVEMKYAEKRAHLTDIMHDTNATQEQKDAAQKQMSHLVSEQETAMRLAFFGGGFSLPGARNAGRTTGLATKGAEEASREMQLHKLIQSGNKDAAATANNTRLLVEALKKNPVLAPLLVGVK